MALNEKNEREFKVLTEREHVLERPAMYIGGIDCVEREMWMFDGDSGKFEYKTVMYNAGAIKCFSEILDNCLDAAIDGQFKTLSKIKVEINGRKITVEDNGPGIPVEVADGDSKGRTKPELAWCQARAGTSFNENRAGMGANGLGSTCTNIFSTKFEGTSDDGKHRQTIKCKDNMAEINPGKITESRRHGVCVEFELDYARFGLPETGFDDIHKTIIYQRMLVLSMMYPKISFSYNGKKIEIDDKKFPAMFSDNALSYKSDNTWILVFENEYDSFHAFTYVNGLEMPRGGTHVNHVSDSISYAARDLLVKKFKTIRPGDIKNKICVAVLMTNFSNPEFDAQNKEQLTNAVPAITKHLNGKFDFNKIAKDLIKTPAIADPIIETFKLKEEVKDRVALKQSLKSKPKIDADKYVPPIGRKNEYFLICEGLSALGGLSRALGRDGIAYYAGRGVPLNVWNCKLSAMLKNKEFTDITSVLGIDPTRDDNKILNFDKIVMANDADSDGIHIQQIYIGWWLRFGKDLFNQRKIARLRTPLIILWKNQKMDEIYKAFYTLNEFKSYEASHDISKYKKNFFKGLGSWRPEQFRNLFESSPNGIEDYLQYFELDDSGNVQIDNWLNPDKSDIRKNYLREFSLDINTI